MSAISQAHQLQGHASPTGQAHVRAVMAGIRRENGVAPVQKAAAVIEQLREMVGPAPTVPAPTVPLAPMSADAAAEDGARGAGAAPSAHASHRERANQVAVLRDRALLLVGFAAALRRSELVAFDVRDVVFTPHAGMVLTVRKSKTDQEGEGDQRGVPFGQNPATCPLRALQAWMAAAGIVEGPLFRAVDRFGRVAMAALSAYAVALIVKRAAVRAGLDPTQYAGHSLALAARYVGRGSGGRRADHHGAGRVEVPGDRAPLHPHRRIVQEERRGRRWALIKSTRLAVCHTRSTAAFASPDSTRFADKGLCVCRTE